MKEIGLRRGRLLLFCLLIITGCSTRTSPLETSSEVKAPAQITDSFQVKTSPTGKIILGIHKQALEKEFLLQGNVIEQVSMPLGRGIKSRIVIFKRRDGRLILIEANLGHLISSDFPKTMLLTSFPILGEDENFISFDFNIGMSKIFDANEMKTNQGSKLDYYARNGADEIRDSYLESATLQPENRLEIRQIAQKSVHYFVNADLNSMYPTSEIRYYLSPYLPREGYEPFVPRNFKQMGFFATDALLLPQGTTYTYSTRFQPGKKIVFAISSNTPVELKGAVRDGILYWNGVIPGSPVEVIDAPKGITAPDMNYNIVQWVPHDLASGAYSDIQTDPRTGEILHAQTYITSNFALMGRQKARKWLRNLKSIKGGSRPSISLKGFETEHTCEKESGSAEGVSALLSKASDEQILRVSQDMIRSTVAHEVGHALGLRHNFASSHGVKNYPLIQRAEIFARYLETGQLDEKYDVQTSVMDYPSFEEDILTGRMLAQHAALSQDKVAMAALYGGVEPDKASAPLFCTDGDVEKILGCMRYDAGTSLAESAAALTKYRIEGLAGYLVEEFIETKSPEPGEIARPIGATSLEPTGNLNRIYYDRNVFIGSLTNSTAMFQLSREFLYFGALNSEDTKKRKLEIIEDQILAVGGLQIVLPLVKSDFAETTLVNIDTLLNSNHYQLGTGSNEQGFVLTGQERDTVHYISALFLGKLHAAIAKDDVGELKKIPDEWKKPEAKMGNSLAALLSERMEEYLFAKKSTVLAAEVQIPAVDTTPARTVKVLLPQYFYETDLRKSAADLLDGKPVNGVTWANAERDQIRNKLKGELETIIDPSFKTLKAKDLTVVPSDQQDKVRTWIEDNQKVLKQLD